MSVLFLEQHSFCFRMEFGVTRLENTVIVSKSCKLLQPLLRQIQIANVSLYVARSVRVSLIVIVSVLASCRKRTLLLSGGNLVLKLTLKVRIDILPVFDADLQSFVWCFVLECYRLDRSSENVCKHVRVRVLPKYYPFS